MPIRSSRRDFLKALAVAGLSGSRCLHAADDEKLPSVRAITKGPKFHWFGYYDKLEFDPASRHVLGMEVDFEHRSPTADNVIKVGMVDLEDKDRWIELGESRAWNWQQGCMLQWLPGSKTEVLWNDRQDDRFVCHILDVKSRKKRTLPVPVYAVSPDGRTGITPDFRRLNDVRPGYGYAGIADPAKAKLAPDDSGIWKIDLASGKQTLLFSIADVMKFPNAERDWKGAKHWFNHLLWAPDGSRFVFLHRWRGEKDGMGFSTRMITAGADGKDLHVLDPFGKTSHFIWRDAQHILAWALHPSHGDRFYLYKDRTDRVEVVGKDVMTVNGHCTYLPGNQWILNDTYPDKERLQHPYLFDTKSGKRHPLGHFRSPPEYTGEWRCDTHPRFSPDGKKVVIDSPHGGNGRQLYLIDVSAILAG
ncbi:MAG: twin-arginine translocation signal domain-containing protein [Gemmataceae bacterium]|nr:twin-arginine translocation signal domain-containing protein [Gemmataceae bacterium]